MTSLGARVDALEVEDTALDTRLDTLEAADTAAAMARDALDTRIAALEAAGEASVIRSIRRGSGTVQANRLITIPTVNIGRAMVMLLSGTVGGGGADGDALAEIGVGLTSPTQVTLYGTGLPETTTVRYQVVEFS